MKIASILLAVACLSGCAAVPAITVAGGGASIFSAAHAAAQDADAILAADAPIKRMICASHPDKSPPFAAWCASIPTDASGLAKQWAAVAVARAVE